MYDMYHWDERPAMLAGLRPAEAADPARRRVAASPKPAVLARGPEAPGTPANSGCGQPFDTGTTAPAHGGQTPGVRAVQVALDRRDNGGDSSASRDQ